MNINIPYGRGFQTLHVPDERLKAVLTPAHEAHQQADQQALVLQALRSPVGSAPVSELAKGKQRITLITSDHTRPVPSALTLPLYLAEIRRGNPEAEITILVATGVHRATTETELRQKFGDGIVDNERIVVHDADAEDLVMMGILPSGGDLWLDRLVAEADLVISEGFVEPHFFAGFSGGRKSILPGVAGRKTIMYNHNAGFIAHPGSRQGSLESNPIHRDMVFAAQTAGLAFILNVILDSDKRVVAAFAGDPVKAHEAACERCLAMTSVPAVQADIVVTSNSGYPLDQNIYQCTKGLSTGEACVREGGVIILCAGLGDGHGGKDFYHWFADRKDAQEVLRDIENIPANETIMDQWQAQIHARVMKKAFCIFVSPEENREMLEAMHMGWAATADDALAMATEMLGENASVTVIPDGVGVIVTNE